MQHPDGTSTGTNSNGQSINNMFNLPNLSNIQLPINMNIPSIPNLNAINSNSNINNNTDSLKYSLKKLFFVSIPNDTIMHMNAKDVCDTLDGISSYYQFQIVVKQILV